MAENTKIEWADHSWSPWRGCTKVSPGCLNCYAETLSKRNPSVLGSWGKGAPRVLAKNWGDPVRWNKVKTCDCGIIQCGVEDFETAICPACRSGYRRQRVFPSLCDWLDEEVSPAWLAEFLALVNLTPNLDWLLLTKRPQNWRERIDDAALASTPFQQRWLVEWLKGTPPVNVWMGVSVEDQTRADERIPLLMEIPARLRWLSVEPLIAPVDLSEWAHIDRQHHPDGSEIPMRRPFDWVVVGGESGHGARPCNVEWVRNIMGECRAAAVPVFVKQLGDRPVMGINIGTGRYRNFDEIRHPKGGDPAEWPADLRVREYPET